MAEKLLTIENLKTYFTTDAGEARAVDGVSFTIDRGETLGLVGESGCGKSVTSLSVMRLIPDPPGRIAGGRILFRRKDIVQMSEDDVRDVRGNDIAMIFQEPMTSLNPVFTCGFQIDEAVVLHQGLDADAAREKTVEMLRLVGIPDPEQRANGLPTPVVRRDAPAGDNRDGAELQSGRADRRRAHYSTGRYDSGPDLGVARAVTGRTGHGRTDDHARSRRHRRSR